MQPVILSLFILSQTTIFFSDFQVNIWITSFMVYAFHGSTILQSVVRVHCISVAINSVAQRINNVLLDIFFDDQATVDTK